MKRFLRFTAMAAVLVASATFASADTIQIGSFGTGDSAMGNNNTSLAYNGFIAQANPPYPANPSSFLSTNPAASTFNISFAFTFVPIGGTRGGSIRKHGQAHHGSQRSRDRLFALATAPVHRYLSQRHEGKL